MTKNLQPTTTATLAVAAVARASSIFAPVAQPDGEDKSPQMERHADPLDEANMLAAAFANSGIAQAQFASRPETHPDFDGKTCVECGEDLPPARLLLKRVRCVTCQQGIETREMQRKRRAG